MLKKKDILSGVLSNLTGIETQHGAEIDKIRSIVLKYFSDAQVNICNGIIRIPTMLSDADNPKIARSINAILTARGENGVHLMCHNCHVANISREIGVKIGLSIEDTNDLTVAGYLHDIGKVVVPDQLLNPTYTYTSEDMGIMKQHCESGYFILHDLFNQKILDAILSHHEDFDGNGYPQGLAGNKIDLFAQIIRIADSFDAMIDDKMRAYSPTLTTTEARENITSGLNSSKYNSQLFPHFVAAVEGASVIQTHFCQFGELLTPELYKRIRNQKRLEQQGNGGIVTNSTFTPFRKKIKSIKDTI